MTRDEPQSLEECKDRVHALEEENEALRESSNTFGHLAERLKDMLERRSQPDRRVTVRPGVDRRQQQSAS